jgi:hypothetical protein
VLLHVDPEPALGVGMGGAGDSAVESDEIDRCDAAGQANPLGNFGDRADRCVLAVMSWHEQHTVLFAHVGGDGDVHVGEDDDVVKWDKQQRTQSFITFLS